MLYENGPFPQVGTQCFEPTLQDGLIRIAFCPCLNLIKNKKKIGGKNHISESIIIRRTMELEL